MKNIFGRIWAVWGLIVFTVTLLLVVLPICLTYLIPEPYGVRLFAFISRVWMTVFLYAVGCPFRFYGKEHFAKGKNYVVVANHSSFLDVPLLTPFLPGGNKTIAKKSMAKIPFFGWIYTRGSVLVDRGSDASRRRSFEAMKSVLRTGLNMLIYPEGTRNRTGQPLKSFYDGAFRLATDAQKDIIPVCVIGTAKALPLDKAFFLQPVFLRVYILPPLQVQGKTAVQLREEAYEVMWKFIEKEKSGKRIS
jgi:1-acyl-sn-glycerol-3-phosphate acyltransferase